MKDFDFDELDKAVSSALSDGDTKNSVNPVPAQQPVANSGNNEILKHSMGRFMDVVKPSLLSNTDTTAPMPTQRQNISIEPISKPSQQNSIDGIVSGNVASTSAKPWSTLATDNSEIALDNKSNDLPMTEPKDEDILPAEEHSMPDPIDFFNKTVDANSGEVNIANTIISQSTSDNNNSRKTLDNSEDSDINKIAEELNKSIKAIDASNIVKDDTTVGNANDGLVNGSPFLSSAKVEKRPLGAYSDQVQDSPNLESQSLQVTNEASDSNDNRQFDQPNQDNYSEEMQGKLMEIESAPISNDSSLSSLEINNEASAKQDNQPIVSQSNPVTVSSAIASIPQQYQEADKDNKTVNSGIYDAENHQPVKYPAKQKSGGMVILWILLLIIIGGAAGAAIYFFVLPLL
jgi:hypothetical protein